MTIINCDMGEGFGLYHFGDDEGLMLLIDVANVARGFHASDFNHVRRTVQLAKRHGVKVLQPHTPTQFMKVTMDQALQARKDRKAVLDGITAAFA